MATRPSFTVTVWLDCTVAAMNLALTGPILSACITSSSQQVEFLTSVVSNLSIKTRSYLILNFFLTQLAKSTG
jgi:hypothetical protein